MTPSDTLAKFNKTPHLGFLLLIATLLCPMLWIGLHNLTTHLAITQPLDRFLTYAISGFIGGIIGLISQQLARFIDKKHDSYNTKLWLIANVVCWVLSIAILSIYVIVYPTI